MLLCISRASETATIDADTLTTVFPTSIVTSNLRGWSTRFNKYLPTSGLESKLFLSFLLSSENKATSHPEKKAERNKKTKRIIILKDQSISK